MYITNATEGGILLELVHLLDDNQQQKVQAHSKELIDWAKENNIRISGDKVTLSVQKMLGFSIEEEGMAKMKKFLADQMSKTINFINDLPKNTGKKQNKSNVASEPIDVVNIIEEFKEKVKPFLRENEQIAVIFFPVI